MYSETNMTEDEKFLIAYDVSEIFYNNQNEVLKIRSKEV